MELKLTLMEAKVALHRLENDGFVRTSEALREVVETIEQLDSSRQQEPIIEAPAAAQH